MEKENVNELSRRDGWDWFSKKFAPFHREHYGKEKKSAEVVRSMEGSGRLWVF